MHMPNMHISIIMLFATMIRFMTRLLSQKLEFGRIIAPR